MSNLFIVATPIGNLSDITLRALDVLRSVDIIAAEDSRVTKKLLQAYNIEKEIIVYHQHSGIGKILDLLQSGKNIAYVSDAGTPGIHDPGGLLVSEVRKNLPEIDIIPIPGVSALTTLASVSGWPTDNFTFLGFLPHKKGRSTIIKSLVNYNHPVFLFESVHRIDVLIKELKEILPSNTKIIIGRELTKIFENIITADINSIDTLFSDDVQKGEYVVGIYPQDK